MFTSMTASAFMCLSLLSILFLIDFPPVDCQQILDTGASKGSGAYSIYNPVDPAKMKDVYCDMETDGGGWLVRNFQIIFDNQILVEGT